MTALETVALVTGANKGIGREIAAGLARSGMTVLLGARDRERGERAVRELADHHLDIRHLPIDVTDERSIADAAEWIEREFGKLDVLVNNAGITVGLDIPPSRTTVADLRQVYEVNVFGVVAVTNALLPLLRKSHDARIVNVSSYLGSLTRQSDLDTPMGLYLAYASSKSACNAVTLHFARELRNSEMGGGIKVNAVEPGLTATDLNGHMGDRSPAEGAKIAVELATAEVSPHGGFFDENGPVDW